MFSPHLPDSDLLEDLLKPLLEDFEYWFDQSFTLLESENIPFLKAEEQADLLARVKQAQEEVRTAKVLLQLTHNQVGVESAILIPWHRLVTECWHVAIRFGGEQSSP